MDSLSYGQHGVWKLRRVLPILLLIWWQAPGGRAEEPEPHSLSSAHDYSLVHPAFIKSATLLTTTNLLNPLIDDTRTDKEKEYQLLYDLARSQWSEKKLDIASKNLVALLQGDAPEEIKRPALIDLALLSQENNELSKSQQLFAQYLKRYPEDVNMPEILLRQGMLYRKMGAPEMALAKFYGVMTGSLKLKFGSLEYYQRLVLQAQTEIAETYFLQGKYAEASDYLKRLLKLDSGNLNKIQIQYKLIRCLAGLGKNPEIIGEAGDFVTRYEKRPEEPEVRYLLAQALKKTGQSQGALQQVLQLLKSQQSRSAEDTKGWIYWQQRAGNTIGNQLYEEGDYLNALAVYQALAILDTAAEWQLPVWYQIGLIYEKLHHPLRAMEFYGRILARKKELDSNTSPGLKTVFDMAQWRTEFINWQNSANLPGATNGPPRLPTVSASR